MLEAAVKYIAEEFRKVTDIPISFAICLLVAGFMMALAMDWQYGAALRTRDAEIATLKSRLDDCRNRPSVALSSVNR
jgi:hypothetical protein